MISPERSALFGKQLVERRRRGRPRTVTSATIHTSVKLPEPLYDALCRRAIAKRQPLHQMMLDALKAIAIEFR